MIVFLFVTVFCSFVFLVGCLWNAYISNEKENRVLREHVSNLYLNLESAGVQIRDLRLSGMIPCAIADSACGNIYDALATVASEQSHHKPNHQAILSTLRDKLLGGPHLKLPSGISL